MNTEQLIELSQNFWHAMENADEEKMREYADSKCQFVHIGITCGLDKEIEFYTSGAFKPTSIEFHSQNATIFNNTAIVLTDCDYALF
jgi:hypothetical protein